MDIRHTTALVTGAASGLGRATAERLAGEGAQVIGIDLAAAIEKVAPFEGVTYVPADVTSEADVRHALSLVSESAPLRIAVNCAGIAPSSRIISSRGVHDLDMFRRTIEVNLIGTFNVLRLAAEVMDSLDADEDGQRGVIINTASVAAYEGQIGQAAYAASKGGVVGLTITAARDLARSGIRVCTIAPGIMETPMVAGFSEEVQTSLARSVTFPQRLGRPEEYAELVTMIVHHDYLNGETIRMDGAIRMEPK